MISLPQNHYEISISLDAILSYPDVLGISAAFDGLNHFWSCLGAAKYVHVDKDNNHAHFLAHEKDRDQIARDITGYTGEKPWVRPVTSSQIPQKRRDIYSEVLSRA